MTGVVPEAYRKRAFRSETIDGIAHHWVWAPGGIHRSRGARVANYAGFAGAAAARSLTLPRPDVVLVSSPSHRDDRGHRAPLGLDAGRNPPIAQGPCRQLRRLCHRRSGAGGHPAAPGCRVRVFSTAPRGRARADARTPVPLSLAARGSRHLAGVGGLGGLAGSGGNAVSAGGTLRALGDPERANGDRSHSRTGAARPHPRRPRSLRPPRDRECPRVRSRTASAHQGAPRHRRGSLRLPLPRRDRRGERSRPAARRGPLAARRHSDASRGRRRRQRARARSRKRSALRAKTGSRCFLPWTRTG